MRSSRLSFFMLIALFLVAHVTQAQSTTILQIGAPQFEAEVVYTDELLARFESEHPGVQVNVVSIDQQSYFNASNFSSVEDYIQNITEFVSSADVLSVSSAHVQPAATRAGLYLDLSPLASADSTLDTNDFYPAAWQSFQWDGGMWAMPSSADVISLSYDPAAFDAAGLTYPDANWTLDDIARAARALTQYDSEGAVSQVGLTIFDQSIYNVIFRSLLGQGFYDNSTQPETPNIDTPEMQALLTTWEEMVADGVVGGGGFGGDTVAPMSIGGSFIYNAGGPTFGRPGQEQQSVLQAAPLPGGSVALDSSGYAVSAGTQYPELAYELAKWLTSQPEISGINTLAARRSMDGVTAQQDDGGPGRGGARAVIRIGGTLPENAQAVIDPLLDTALATSEWRYGSYVQAALSLMQSDGVDAQSALQEYEAQAVSDLATADASTTQVIVAAPEAEVVLAAGEIALNFGMQGIGFAQGNQEAWDSLIADFVASDPQVGQVNIADGFGQDVAANDCYYQSFNDVPNADLSTLLSLDPYLDADPNFERNDIISGILSQVQRDNQTWALPLTLQPTVLQYDTTQFQNAGALEPIEGWTTDEFENALRALYANNPDAAPFAGSGGGGLYMLQLIAAYGGLPLDFRTDPPTVDFTSPETVNAIRQVLDLAKEGLIEYEQTGGFNVVVIGGGQTAAVYPDSFFGFGGFGPGGQDNPYQMTTFPTGSQYTPLAMSIGTAYISATTQNPDACYRFISTLAQHPELFSGMPTRYSVLNDPAYTATQNEATLTTYNRIAELAAQPNTIVFPSLQGGTQQNFLLQYWLNQAFDNYVLNDADLDTELAQAQQYAIGYQECVAGIPAFDASQGDFGDYVAQVQQCATLVDPNLTSVFPGQ
ncbi:MAG: extracellular solute-binding protein [Anaerolineae bacterium]